MCERETRTEDKLPLIGVCWVLTTRCNLSCPECFGIEGLADGDREKQMRMIDIIAHSGVIKLTFAGGEPLLVPHVADLIEYAGSKGLVTALFTNGILLDTELIDRLERGGLGHLALPLEGSTAEIHAKMRGSGEHHQVVLDLLPQVVGRGFKVEVSTVVTKINADDLPALGDLLERNRVPKWKIFQFYPLARGARNRERFMLSDVTFSESTCRLRDRFLGMDIDIQPASDEKQASYFNLAANGDVYTVIDDAYVWMGNIFDRSPNEIWNTGGFDRGYHHMRHSRDVMT